MRNNHGYSLIEFMMVLVLGLGVLGYAVPKLTDIVKRQNTVKELQLLSYTLLVYEDTYNKIPNNLNDNDLEAMYPDESYKKDAWGDNYTYSKSARTICTSNIQVGNPASDYCVNF